jgi:hypothetical protein
VEDLLLGIGVGLTFAVGGLICFGILIGIGELLEVYERWKKK